MESIAGAEAEICSLNSEVARMRPSLSKECLGTIFATIYRTSNCTTNCAKTSSKTRYSVGGFCTILWYNLRYDL